VPTPETLEELLVLIRSDLTLLIRLINEESRKDAIEDTIGSIKAKGQERIEKLNEQIKEIEKQLEASKEAASSSKTKSILGWIGAALAVVAAVAAVIATAGAATPLLVGACIMVGVAVASLGMQIAQEATGGAYFPGKGISMMLQAMGVDEKTADIAGMVVVGGLMLIASVTAAILSFGAGSGGAVSNIANMAKLIRTAAAVANSAMAITSGALAIDSALDKYESDLAGATLKEIQALLEKLKALTEQEEDFLRALMAEEKTITDLVDRIVESAMAAIQSMAGNIAAPGMA
jgi:cell division septum initiation protein DivIVA